MAELVPGRALEGRANNNRPASCSDYSELKRDNNSEINLASGKARYV